MGLIKSHNTPPSIAPFSMRDIESHAKAIILRAQQQVDQMLASAKTEGAKIRQKAYDEGFAAGTQDGLRKGTEDGRATGKQAALAEHRANLEQLAKSLTASVSDLDSSRGRLESAASTEVVKLAVAIARRVTKLQGSLDPSVLTENVREAMKLVIHSTDVRIAVNPSQKQTLAETLPQLRIQWPNLKHVELVEDASVAPGGCMILTVQGQIDADLDRQIDRVAADLLPSANPGTASS
jgi:flagellar assembly protein FliH